MMKLNQERTRGGNLWAVPTMRSQTGLRPTVARRLGVLQAGMLAASVVVFTLVSGCNPCNQPSDCPVSDVCTIDGFCIPEVDHSGAVLPATGRFSDFRTCDVVDPPNETQLATQYTQYTNCTGIPVVAIGDVPPPALAIASETIEFLIGENENLRNRMISSNEFHILRGPGISARDLPTSFPGAEEDTVWSFDGNAHASTSRGRYLFCDFTEPGFYGSNLFVEVMARHMFAAGAPPGTELEARVFDAFGSALDNGLWGNTIVLNNPIEYFGELTTKWFEVGRPAGPPEGDGVGNDIITRQQLRTYDPDGAALMESIFSDSFDVPGCIRRNSVVGADD